jgi:hypothetical protein
MNITAFIAERMSAYISGGMRPDTAARFARGELLAIYKGNHRSRDASGAFRVTPPPEALGIEAAMRKAEAALAEILKASAGSGAAKKTGLEGLKNYARGNVI